MFNMTNAGGELGMNWAKINGNSINSVRLIQKAHFPLEHWKYLCFTILRLEFMELIVKFGRIQFSWYNKRTESIKQLNQNSWIIIVLKYYFTAWWCPRNGAKPKYAQLYAHTNQLGESWAFNSSAEWIIPHFATKWARDSFFWVPKWCFGRIAI